ncbi:hypothetical protein MNBD_GAMMA24-2096 [hydrothermal vent metagenome]|uniref:NHL repeat domain protein n=1 Tax=hydrothermal vent metagenome TaxID=652676 RepID=A0A3B1B4Z9_9ZZZZ
MQRTRFIDYFLFQSGCKVWRVVFVLVMVSILAACTGLPGSRSSENKNSSSSQLLFWRNIDGGVQESSSAVPAAGGYIQLGRPVSVAAWADYVYIADAGRQAILRYDRRREVFSVFYRMPITAATRIIVTAGEYLYITDPIQSRILYLDRNARLLREITDFNLKQPVAITDDDSLGQILVADAFYNQILVFNKLGRLIQTIHPVDGTGAPISGLADMVVRKEKIYLLDRLLRQIVVTDLNGAYLQTIGSDRLQQPVAMRIDDTGRILVADAFDNSLLFFSENGVHKISAKSESVMTMQLAGMDLHETWLYLVDVAAARIQVMKLLFPVAATAEQKK